MKAPERSGAPQSPELSGDETPSEKLQNEQDTAQGSGLELALTPEQIAAEKKERAAKAARAVEFSLADNKGRERMSADAAREREDRAEQEAKEAAFALARKWQERVHAGKKRIEEKAAEDGGSLAPDEQKENDAIVTEAEREFDAFKDSMDEFVITDKAGMEEALVADSGKWARPAEGEGIAATASAGEAEVVHSATRIEDLRTYAKEMRTKRETVATLRAKLTKYDGIGGIRALLPGGASEKSMLAAELVEAEKDYEAMRAEYVGEKAYRKNKEEMLLADAAGAALTKEKGVSGKVYDAYKWLGDQNLTKLGWKPTGKIGGMVARGVSLRSGVNIALMGGGFALGGAVGVAATIPARRVLGGIFGSASSFDGMRHFFDRQKSLSQAEVKKMDYAELLSRMDALRAQAATGGRAVSKDAEFLRLKAELGTREKSALERGLLTTEYLGEAMDAANDRLKKVAKKRGIRDAALKGVAVGVGTLVGTGVLAEAVGGVAKAATKVGAEAGKIGLEMADSFFGTNTTPVFTEPVITEAVTLPSAAEGVVDAPPDIIHEAPSDAVSSDILPDAPPEEIAEPASSEVPNGDTEPAAEGPVSLDDALLKPGEEVGVSDEARDAVIAKIKATQGGLRTGGDVVSEVPVQDIAETAKTTLESGRFTFDGGRAMFETDDGGRVISVAVEGRASGIPGVLRNGYEFDIGKQSDYYGMDESFAVNIGEGEARDLTLQMNAYKAMLDAGKQDTPEGRFLVQTIRAGANDLRRNFGAKMLKPGVFTTIAKWTGGA